MFYKTTIQDFIRVPPDHFGLSPREAIVKRIKKDYEGFISKEVGIVIDVSEVLKVNEGVVIPGDGASYYESEFVLLVFKPELQEVIQGNIKDIADFGAFITMGPIEGMIHISQTMDDFVSFSKEKSLLGKESKKVLKISDRCRARIIALSFKDISNPKLGLTMRQEGLGRIDWILDNGKEKSVQKV
jgi:DNA-directed RNA polymerase subunit E'